MNTNEDTNTNTEDHPAKIGLLEASPMDEEEHYEIETPRLQLQDRRSNLSKVSYGSYESAEPKPALSNQDSLKMHPATSNGNDYSLTPPQLGLISEDGITETSRTMTMKSTMYVHVIVASPPTMGVSQTRNTYSLTHKSYHSTPNDTLVLHEDTEQDYDNNTISGYLSGDATKGSYNRPELELASDDEGKMCEVLENVLNQPSITSNAEEP